METSILGKLKERGVYKTFIIYLAGSWGVLEALDFFSNRFRWPDLLFDLTLVLLICGLPFSILKTWFHGSPGKQKTSKAEIVLMSMNVILAVYLISYTVFKRDHPEDKSTSTPPVATSKSIAVLPFTNMSNDPEQDYFSDGITEDILNHLVKISTLNVKSRTSTWKYKSVQRDVQEIGKDLGVSSVLEGSIRKAGNVVRIVVQLIDVKSDQQLWSETYDREIKDVFRVQSEIAMEVVRALNTILSQAERNYINVKSSTDITAYDYFLKARQIINQSNDIRRDYDNALKLIQQALTLDPEFSAAYALKARVWRWLGTYGTDYKTWIDSTLYYSTKSIELNPSLPEGYLIRSGVFSLLNKRNQSKKDLYRAYEVSPNDPIVLETLGYDLLEGMDERGAEMVLESLESRYSKRDPEYYWILGWIYFDIGNYEKAERLLKQGKNLDPGSIEPYWRLAFVYRAAKRYQESVKESEQALTINPTNKTMIDNLAWAYFLNGDLEKAATQWAKYSEIESTFEDSTQHVPFRHRLGYVKWLMGNKKEAIRLFEEEIQLEHRVVEGKAGLGVWPTTAKAGNYYDLAASMAFLKHKQQALIYLDSAVTHGLSFDWGLKYDPLFGEIRSDRKFTQIAEKVFSRKKFAAEALNRALQSKGSNQI